MDTTRHTESPKYWSVLLTIIFFLISGFSATKLHYTLPEDLLTSLHTTLGVIITAVAFLAFAICWEVQKKHQIGNYSLLGCCLLAAGWLELAHSLSFLSTPELISNKGSGRTTFFSQAAHFMPALGLLMMAANPFSRLQRQPKSMIGATLLLTLCIYAIGFSWLAWIPPVSSESLGQGALNVTIEYILAGIYLITALILFRRFRGNQGQYYVWLAASAFIAMQSALIFSWFSNTNDITILIGHLYGIISYWLIYKSIISCGVHIPFEQLQKTVLQLQIAEQHNQLSKWVFEATDEALMITNADQTIIAVNPAFTTITGYSQAEVQGKTPHLLLASGRHDKIFYRQMWQSLQEQGRWSGEIWNRRKNGAVYPEWLKITQVKDFSGGRGYYVAAFSDLSEIRLAQQAAEKLAWHDPLTGLPNRAKLLRELDRILTSLKSTKGVAKLIFVSLNRFKEVNDALGLSAGDEYLRNIANTLTNQVRPRDMLARVGANKFALLRFHQQTDKTTIATHTLEFANRLHKILLNDIQLQGQNIVVHVNIGITLVDQQQHITAEDIISQAELALTQARQVGPDATAFFEPRMGELAKARFLLERELQQAIFNDQLLFYIQPQVNDTGELVGGEALVRWRHPERGLVPPNDFIPLAEQSDIIIDIDHWMLKTACTLLSKLGSIHPHLRIAVNISPRHFQQEDFVAQICEHLRKNGALPQQLTLEITEALMIGDLNDIIDKMNQLSALGIHLSMDDFGTGYSSLSYLKRLPIHELKIDRSFVLDITTDSRDAALVTAIISVAEHMNLKVVAEGVETQEQAEFLNAHGEIIHQGYYFGRPEPVDVWLNQWKLTEQPARLKPCKIAVS